MRKLLVLAALALALVAVALLEGSGSDPVRAQEAPRSRFIPIETTIDLPGVGEVPLMGALHVVLNPIPHSTLLQLNFVGTCDSRFQYCRLSLNSAVQVVLPATVTFPVKVLVGPKQEPNFEGAMTVEVNDVGSIEGMTFELWPKTPEGPPGK